MLPEEFKRRLREYPGLDSEALFDSLENQKPVKAFRINTDKLRVEDFLRLCDFDLSPVPYMKDGFYTDVESPGQIPLHAAGAMYMQDPGAMSTVAAIDLKEGSKVLDVCAAPGGKTLQLSSLVGDSGIVVSNEYVTKRCRILESNADRMGCRNVVITNLDTKFLYEVYGTYFDCVLVDAPCSGEGMFRKNELAVDEWSIDNILHCRDRQREILENVYNCVLPGGLLVYSTCTFSIEENEENIACFLDRHPDFTLVPAKDEVVKCTSDGIDIRDKQMSLARRFYPHICPGEGQFVAILQRDKNIPIFKNNDVMARRNPKNKPDSVKNKEFVEAIKCAEAFLNECLDTDYTAMGKSLKLYNGFVYLTDEIPFPDFGLFSPGICVGEFRNRRIVPHHRLFSAFGNKFKNKVMLSADSECDRENLKAYLRGSEFFIEQPMRGWASLMYEGIPVGGIKVSGGVCKNHFPKSMWI